MSVFSLRPSALICTGALVLTSGCGDTCHDSSGELVVFSEGQTNPEQTFYQTGPLQGPYLHFPSGRIFELEHELAGAPDEFDSLLSFDSRALLDKNNNVAESAGNQVVVECVDAPLRDGEGVVQRKGIIRVRNDTCADFYLRVSAEFHGGPASPVARSCR